MKHRPRSPALTHRKDGAKVFAAQCPCSAPNCTTTMFVCEEANEPAEDIGRMSLTDLEANVVAAVIETLRSANDAEGQAHKTALLALMAILSPGLIHAEVEVVTLPEPTAPGSSSRN